MSFVHVYEKPAKQLNMHLGLVPDMILRGGGGGGHVIVHLAAKQMVALGFQISHTFVRQACKLKANKQKSIGNLSHVDNCFNPVKTGGFLKGPFISPPGVMLISHGKRFKIYPLVASQVGHSHRCMMDRSAHQLVQSMDRLVGGSIHHTSGWTLPLVMSLEGRFFTWLVMANQHPTW